MIALMTVNIAVYVVAFAVILLLIYWLSKSKYNVVAIPATFAVLFAFTLYTTQFYGYAIDVSIAKVKEAMVFNVTEGQDKYFVLIRQTNEKDLRLISMEKNDGNKETFDKLEKELQTNGFAIIRESDGSGEGEADGPNGAPSGNGLEIIGIEQSSLLSKEPN